MFARNCDFSADACSSSTAWCRSSLFCRASSVVAATTLASSSLGRLLDLLVEPRAFESLGPIVQDRHDRNQLAGLGQHLAGDRLVGQQRAGGDVTQRDLAAAADFGPAESSPEMNEEKCASLARKWR